MLATDSPRLSATASLAVAVQYKVPEILGGQRR
jgi:hypothetical protein